MNIFKIKKKFIEQYYEIQETKLHPEKIKIYILTINNYEKSKKFPKKISKSGPRATRSKHKPL